MNKISLERTTHSGNIKKEARIMYSQRSPPRTDTSAGPWERWWEPEPRSWRPGWGSPGPSERHPEPAWSSSVSGTPWAGTGCGTATQGSRRPGHRRRCCLRRGTARSAAWLLSGATDEARKDNDIHKRGAAACFRGSSLRRAGKLSSWRSVSDADGFHQLRCSN